jgi:ATP-dependent Clp protease ATP-binding subunit ClpX
MGIIFIDEIDKISRKGESQSLTRDVSGEGTQQALLKLLEGSACTIPADPHPGGRKHPEQKVIEINTENILFVVGGAFVGLEEIIAKRTSASSIGFGAKTKSSKKEKAGETFKRVVVDDFVKFGMLPELMGRLPIITTLEDLSEEDMTKILTQPRNALLKQFTTMFEMDGQKLTIEPDAIHDIVVRALERNTGARGLRGVVEEVLEDVMFESPSSEKKEIIISSSMVKEKFNKTNKIAA